MRRWWPATADADGWLAALDAVLLGADAGAALPSAVAYHERVVTPTGKVYLACASGAPVSSRARIVEVGSLTWAPRNSMVASVGFEFLGITY